MHALLCKYHQSVAVSLSQHRYLNESCLCDNFNFLVFELALFWASIAELIQYVYNYRFWCRLEKQRYLPNDLGKCSEPLFCFETVCCTAEYLYIKRFYSSKTWKKISMWVCNRMVSPKYLLLADINSIGIVVTVLSRLERESSTLFHCFLCMFGFEDFDVNFMKREVLFSQKDFWFKLGLTSRPIVSPTRFWTFSQFCLNSVVALAGP